MGPVLNREKFRVSWHKGMGNALMDSNLWVLL